ncbi:MAG TPA: hypothetical protein VJM82_08420 [Nitrospiraceae bacterium]|nr:hypothetical protein [Nitrospiraceae bacterium]
MIFIAIIGSSAICTGEGKGETLVQLDDYEQNGTPTDGVETMLGRYKRSRRR